MRLLASKRAKIIGSILVVLTALIAIGGLVAYLGGQQRLHNIRRDLEQTAKQLESAQTKLVQSRTRDERLEHLKILAKIPEVKCDMEWWFSWQSGAVDAEDMCQYQREKAKNISAKAARLEGYVTDEGKIAAVLKTLEIDETSDNWQQQAAAAVEAAVSDLAQLKVNHDAEPVRKEAHSRVSQLDKAWKTLVETEERQRKDDYLQALQALKDAYAGLESITTTSDEQINLLIDELAAAMRGIG